MNLSKNNIPIVFTFNKKFMLPALVAIKSLLLSANQNTFYDIYLLIDRTIDDELQNCIFDKLSEFNNKKITFKKVDDKLFKNFPSTKKWPKIVYYRLLIPAIIKNYDKIIYSDVDVLFKKDLNQVYNIDLKDNYWAGVAAEKNKDAICHQYYPENPNEYIYMSGFMLMNLDKMRKENIISKFGKIVKKYSKKLKMFDLEILNLSCNKILALPIEYCVLENIYDKMDSALEFPWLSKIYSKNTLLKAQNNPAIIHYAGRDDKIWTRSRNKINKNYLEILDSICPYLNILQIGDNDLLGNKFNGHDLHLYLREKNLNANHLVVKKKSKDFNTFHFNEAENFSSNILKSDLFSNSDIVHLHLIHNTSFEITHLPIFSALKPTVITLHDPFFTTGHCIHSFDCEKWKQNCKDCPKLDLPIELDNDISALNFKIKKDSIQNSQISAIVASDYMENLVKQSPIWKGKKIYKLPFGINQEIFKPVDKTLAKKNLGINKDNIVLMFRSSSLPYKGIETIKNALRNLKTDKKITVITVNEKRNFKEFKNKFKIKEYGWVYDDKKLAQLYQAADIFLMPSEQEAFGLMAIEAMSSKVPVISIKGTSLESVTNAPECGICCEKEDFSNELNRLINNADEIKLRAEKSYQYAKENYDKEVYIKRMIEIYQDIIKNHKIEPEWQDVLGQMEKYNINNYYVDNKIAIAKNPIWRLIYRLLIRPFLKKKYDKKTLKTRFDRKYL